MKDKLEDILDFIRDIPMNIRIFFEMLEQMWFWAWNMRKNMDWDGMFIYDLLHLKLDRMVKHNRKYGHFVWNTTDSNLMRKLIETAELARRLAHFHYNIQHIYDCKAVYGEWKPDLFTPKEKRCKFTWANVTNDDQQRKAEIMYKIRRKYWGYRQKQETERFWYLLDKYMKHWWD